MDLSVNDLNWSIPDCYKPISIEKGVIIAKRYEDGKLFAIKRTPIEAKTVYQQLRKYRYKGIPKVEEVIDNNSFLIIVEEYINAPNLRTFLDRGITFSKKEAERIIISLTTILKPLHSCQTPIIHRDIKPENILLDSIGNVWLIDWGAAKKENSQKNRDTVLMGTEGYAAPEQYGFSQSEPATDIYALGVLLNEMVTGCLIGEKKCGGRLGTIIDKCTELEKTKRYKNVDELRKAIQYNNWRRWLPPGFRGKGIGKKIIFLFLYYLLAYSTLTMDIDNSRSMTETILNRIFAFILFFSNVLLFGNWGNIWSYLPILNRDKKEVKFLGLIIWSLIVTTITMIIFYIFEKILL